MLKADEKVKDKVSDETVDSYSTAEAGSLGWWYQRES